MSTSSTRHARGGRERPVREAGAVAEPGEPDHARSARAGREPPAAVVAAAAGDRAEQQHRVEVDVRVEPGECHRGRHGASQGRAVPAGRLEGSRPAGPQQRPHAVPGEEGDAGPAHDVDHPRARARRSRRCRRPRRRSAPGRRARRPRRPARRADAPVPGAARRRSARRSRRSGRARTAGRPSWRRSARPDAKGAGSMKANERIDERLVLLHDATPRPARRPRWRSSSTARSRPRPATCT